MLLLYALLLNAKNLTYVMDLNNLTFMLLFIILILNQIVMLIIQTLSLHYDFYHSELQTIFGNLQLSLIIK
jgi:hypothetical protein